VARWQQSFNHAALHACRVSHNNQNARNNRCPCSIVPCGTTISAGAAATPACRPSPRPMHLRVHELRRPQRGPPVAKATGAARRESNGGRPHVYTYIYIFVFCSGGHDHKMCIEDRRPFTRPGRVGFWAPNAGFCIEGAPEPKIRRGPPLKRGNLKIIRGPPLYIYIIIVMGPDYTHAKNLPQEAAGATAHHGRHRCRRIRRRSSTYKSPSSSLTAQQ
jgi:hypothetical protein